MKYELIRNANVEVQATRDANNHPVALIDINGTHEHRFDAKSRISKSLDVMSANDLQARLTDGQYFFIEDQLVDLRDGNYSGFVHTDDSIDNLVNTIGIQEVDKENPMRSKVHKNLISNNWILGAKWSDHDITVPGYKDGGEFNSELHFAWNPFVKTVNSAFMLWRLICTNGMEGLASILNTKIPLINRWEEHLDIANKQIQNKISAMVPARLSQMGNERATVAETMLVAQHAQMRAKEAPEKSQRNKLSNIESVVHPMSHVGHVYKSNVFADKRLAAQMPSHLTTFDLYNIITEMRTHTSGCTESTDHALDKMANTIVFDRQDQSSHASRFMLPQQSSFSSPDAAFFGDMV